MWTRINTTSPVVLVTQRGTKYNNITGVTAQMKSGTVTELLFKEQLSGIILFSMQLQEPGHRDGFLADFPVIITQENVIVQASTAAVIDIFITVRRV
jgi:hypothetical protein